MVALLAVSFLILGFIAFFAIRRFRAGASEAYVPLPPVPPPSLFQPDPKEMAALRAADEEAASAAQAEAWLARAMKNDRQVLLEIDPVKQNDDYDAALMVLAGHEDARSFAELSTLAAFVIDHDLPANENLVRSVMDHCRESPDRSAAIMLLHLAARSNDAELFGEAFALLDGARGTGRIPSLSAEELMTLADSEFWVLNDIARNSGAGFLLKQQLADARRELAAAARDRV